MTSSRPALTVCLLVLVACGSSPTTPSATPTPTATPTPGLSSDLVFYVDAGLRLDNAEIPAASVQGSTVHLYYQDWLTRHQMATTSTDGLTFSGGRIIAKDSDRTGDARRTLLPDGTWRLYFWNNDRRVLSSMRSATGTFFSDEDGSRYDGHTSDNGSMGIHEAFTVGSEVVLLYLGDLPGLNNLRRAVSTDGGVTFRFDRADVLGDAALGGGSRSFVDPESLLLPDGRRRLFVMKQGSVYSFVSSDGARTFTQDAGTRLAPSDFTEYAIEGLYDPTPVRLSDGRYRIYAAARIGTRFAIVSATTR